MLADHDYKYPKPSHPPAANLYIELRQQVEQAGLLERQVPYYLYKIVFTLSLLGVGSAILALTSNLWTQLASAAFMAFVFSQLAFLSHDLGHGQVFSTPRANDIVGLIIGNVILGVSYGWWKDKHRQHHAHPNQVDLDPDITLSVLAFNESQSVPSGYPVRFIIRYQALFFLPLLTLSVIAMRLKSIAYLLLIKHRNLRTELVLLGIHGLVYFGTLYALLGIFRGLLFCVVHQSLFGIYLGLTFATNHKGMPILERNSELEFLHRQILTTRNLKAHRFTDYMYGALGTQIEHHLFPTIARNRLREAGVIVKSFCEKRGIAYHETGVFRAYYEIMQHLHTVAVPLRRKDSNRS